jgi:hypothetical protein
MNLLCLSTFVYILIYAFYFVLLKCVLMKYFKVLRNKNPDENLDLPIDFENLDRKSKSTTFVKCL